MLLVIVLYTGLTYLYRNADFYRATVTGIKKEEAPIDLVAVGSSEMMVYYQPKRAYEELGITSWNMSTDGAPADALIYYIRWTCKYKKPKAAVIGVRTIMYWSDQIYEGYLRNASDSMDLGITRVQLLNNFFQRRTIPAGTDISSYYFDLAFYHNRNNVLNSQANWNAISNCIESPEKGWMAKPAYCWSETPPQSVFTDRRNDLQDISYELVDEIFEECRKNNITPYFVVTPFSMTEYEKANFNTLQDYIEKNGGHFLDCNEHLQEMGIDFSTDFYNNYHVNVSGSTKFTSFIASYIQKDMNLPDRRGEHYPEWDSLAAGIPEFDLQTEDSILQLKTQDEAVKAEAEHYSMLSDTSEWAAKAGTNPELYWLVAVNQDMTQAFEKNSEVFASLGLTKENLSKGSVTARYTEKELQLNKLNNTEGAEQQYQCALRPPYHQAVLACSNGQASIKVDGEECCTEGKGIHVVLYNYKYPEVVDSVCLSTDENGNLVLNRQ